MNRLRGGEWAVALAIAIPLSLLVGAGCHGSDEPMPANTSYYQGPRNPKTLPASGDAAEPVRPQAQGRR